MLIACTMFPLELAAELVVRRTDAPPQAGIDEARKQGVHNLMAATLQAWEEAVRRTGAQADYSKVIRHVEIDAGVEVRARSTGKE